MSRRQAAPPSYPGGTEARRKTRRDVLMLQMRHQVAACALVLGGALASGGFTVHADRWRGGDHDHGRSDPRVKTVFVIAMENHNWTQPAGTSPQQIFMNQAAPFINSLVNGASGISSHVAYATNYQNAGIGIHPSEPNYIWAEAGTNFGVLNDDDPYHSNCTPDTNQATDQHLSAFLMKKRKTWKSYQEDVNVNLMNNVPLVTSAWTVPLFSQSGHFVSGMGINAYNYSSQYNYAAKHNPMVFFSDTNLGCPAATSTEYPPLQQLAIDLQNNT